MFVSLLYERSSLNVWSVYRPSVCSCVLSWVMCFNTEFQVHDLRMHFKMQTRFMTWGPSLRYPFLFQLVMLTPWWLMLSKHCTWTSVAICFILIYFYWQKERYVVSYNPLKGNIYAVLKDKAKSDDILKAAFHVSKEVMLDTRFILYF